MADLMMFFPSGNACSYPAGERIDFNNKDNVKPEMVSFSGNLKKSTFKAKKKQKFSLLKPLHMTSNRCLTQ